MLNLLFFTFEVGDVLHVLGFVDAIFNFVLVVLGDDLGHTILFDHDLHFLEIRFSIGMIDSLLQFCLLTRIRIDLLLSTFLQ